MTMISRFAVLRLDLAGTCRAGGRNFSNLYSKVSQMEPTPCPRCNGTKKGRETEEMTFDCRLCVGRLWSIESFPAPVQKLVDALDWAIGQFQARYDPVPVIATDPKNAIERLRIMLPDLKDGIETAKEVAAICEMISQISKSAVVAAPEAQRNLLDDNLLQQRRIMRLLLRRYRALQIRDIEATIKMHDTGRSAAELRRAGRSQSYYAEETAARQREISNAASGSELRATWMMDTSVETFLMVAEHAWKS